MKALVLVGEVWIDPLAIVALWDNGQGATMKFSAADAPLTIPGASVAEVLSAVEKVSA